MPAQARPPRSSLKPGTKGSAAQARPGQRTHARVQVGPTENCLRFFLRAGLRGDRRLRERSEREEVHSIPLLPPEQKLPCHPWPAVCDSLGCEFRFPQTSQDPTTNYARRVLLREDFRELPVSHTTFLCAFCYRALLEGGQLRLKDDVFGAREDVALAVFRSGPSRREVLRRCGAPHTPKANASPEKKRKNLSN